MNSPLEIALAIGFLILSLGIHEAAHAWVAYMRGDSTAKDLGRLTLNPVVHIDPFMTILLPAILVMAGGPVFGGAKPVPVDYYRLKSPLRDMMLVAIAGPLTNFLLAILFSVVWKTLVIVVGMHPEALAPRVMEQAMVFNVILAIFNMIPVPPLDGSRVLAWLLPSGIRESYVSLERFGLLIVGGLLATGALRSVLLSTYRPVLDAVHYLSGGAW